MAGESIKNILERHGAYTQDLDHDLKNLFEQKQIIFKEDMITAFLGENANQEDSEMVNSKEKLTYNQIISLATIFLFMIAVAIIISIVWVKTNLFFGFITLIIGIVFSATIASILDRNDKLE